MQNPNFRLELDSNEIEIGALRAEIVAAAPRDGDQLIAPALYVARIDQLVRRNEHLLVLLS